MSEQIKNIQHTVSKSINFEWNFHVPDGNRWNMSTQDLSLKDNFGTCSLSLGTEYNYSTGYHNVEVKITFANFDMIVKSIVVILIHQASQRSFSFHLKKECNNSHVFCTKEKISANSFSESNQNLKVVILYENDSMYEDKILVSDLKQLLENEKYADFKIKTQNVTFKVHKGILSCRCNVLAKALESDMVEKQSSEMQLDLWDPAVVKEFLFFIYTGSCEISPNPHQLFELANYYQLDELKLKCSGYLQNNMNLKNIVHTLELADEEQYNLKDLQFLAHSFVKENELPLVKDIDFQNYLSKSIRMNNLVFVLRLAYTYSLKVPLESAKNFIKLNYGQVLENEECRNYLSSQGELLLDILKYTLDSTLNK